MPNSQTSTQIAQLPKAEVQRIEQRTLKISLYTLVFLAVGSLVYGVYIKSSVVVLNGVYSMVSLAGSWLNLFGARIVTRPEDNRFQYGYAHIEPLIHSANALILLIICLYAFVSGIGGIRAGGGKTDTDLVIGFTIVTGLICFAIWFYEVIVSKQINSQFVRNDAKEWFMDFVFSFITFIGFAFVFVLNEPFLSLWERYADSAMVAVISLCLLPLPIRVLKRNIPEILLITHSEDVIFKKVNAAMLEISTRYKLLKYTTHVVKVGQSYFVEVNILVEPDCDLQTIAQQDALREEIWKACDKPLEELWLSVCITADKRWN
ncbi:cation diffusion facilitator family transporter [Desulfovibrio litoralis]|uniref:Cation diffusion facilitator family transporter n=1 Tax=Desulfovibrio litoralis DSM 11393 TaxID=1121455 RepID=A0A1M7SA13_9BACT|nr:cation diffusion facilitator family transporter [Desulfovibrio litoralis]SHN55255.1 cation diffusion facilitator family transporter [Desulfovibrio litoralis DSM 11393]